MVYQLIEHPVWAKCKNYLGLKLLPFENEGIVQYGYMILEGVLVRLTMHTKIPFTTKDVHYTHMSAS